MDIGPDDDFPTECPTCEGAGWDWKRVADDGPLPDDPVGEYPCPDCTPQSLKPIAITV